MRLARRGGGAGTITPAAAWLSYRETVAAFLLSFRRRNSLLDVLRTTRDDPTATSESRPVSIQVAARRTGYSAESIRRALRSGAIRGWRAGERGAYGSTRAPSSSG